MYIRTIKRKNKDGSVVEYVQLANNVWNKKKGFAQAQVIHSFGRSDQLDVEALKRLIKSMSRFLDPEDAVRIEHKDDDLKIMSSRPSGGAHLLKALWNRLRINNCLQKGLDQRSFSSPVADAIFAMVANRALAPSSKLAIEQWAAEEVYLGNKDTLQVQHCYRAMDFLLEHQETIQQEVFWSTANLLNLTVDLIFFDTTNTYFETDEPGPSELKAYGKSKDKRDDLPQVTIGLAVTREGIPVRCWVLPGNQHDSKCVDQVQKDLNSWNLGRVVWVMDRGMTSQANQKILQRAGGQYILGEKLSGNKLNEAVLSHPGRFKVVTDNLHIKEVFAGEGTGSRRYVIAYNPKQAELDRINRQQVLERLSCELEILNKTKKTKAHCNLLLHRSMGRYVKELKSGKLRLDKAKVKQDEKLDGKYLLSTSDQHMSAEDIALGYKQLLEVERAFRTLKSTLSLRPVYHSKDDRVRSHVLICWLALLLVRIAEVETGLSWAKIRQQMQQQNLIDLFGKNGRILQHTELTHTQRNILNKLNIKPPQRILQAETAA
ncbi:IS1634 family transposase [Desulforhopalus sp. IMCC35007]|uniref:IS1634 family transposase n=1 Tax=Desulforhopalus sp. IMCC35007 TaxID=2569543 RepID=UPI0010AE329A|nr:IS1634 family transposase [Desulforhopalus sp. IMCC35007]TKB09252.1 IS1634 family transposase [Desulforhopalus sp. IMCC35007]